MDDSTNLSHSPAEDRVGLEGGEYDQGVFALIVHHRTPTEEQNDALRFGAGGFGLGFGLGGLGGGGFVWFE
jgi:hypothetical protein